MNREQRRRKERDRRRRHAQDRAGRPIPLDGPGRLVHGGDVQKIERWAEMPPKVAGMHRWIATTVHTLGDHEAEGFSNPLVDSYLDTTSIVYAGVGCLDCEQPWETVRSSPCQAGDTWTEP